MHLQYRISHLLPFILSIPSRPAILCSQLVVSSASSTNLIHAPRWSTLLYLESCFTNSRHAPWSPSIILIHQFSPSVLELYPRVMHLSTNIVNHQNPVHYFTYISIDFASFATVTECCCVMQHVHPLESGYRLTGGHRWQRVYLRSVVSCNRLSTLLIPAPRPRPSDRRCCCSLIQLT